jgi:thiamine-phosphate pyrophosphorylase
LNGPPSSEPTTTRAWDSHKTEPGRPITCYVTDRQSLPTGPVDPVTNLLKRIRLCIESGLDWIQIREKDLSGRALLAVARDAVSEAKLASKNRSAPRIYVNDRLDVALRAHASGVHLGSESLPAADVLRWCRRGSAPPEFDVGVSCHSIECARQAEQDGANYVFFGPVFDTPSKRAYGPPQGLDRLREVCRAVRIPVIAIGGVNEANADDSIRFGASGIAAVRLFQEKSKEVLMEFLDRIHACSA